MARFAHLVSSVIAALGLVTATTAEAELLAMANYESRPGNPMRKEAIAILDLDPASPAYKSIVAEIPLPHDIVAHHIFYAPDADKAYVTALAKGHQLRVLDMNRYPYRMKMVDVPGCQVGEDVSFSAKLGRWYLTCMGSSRLVVGDLATDQVIGQIDLPAPWPHGVAVHDGIDRILVTSTVDPSLSPAGEEIVVIEASTNTVLSKHKVSNKPSPSGAAPVEAFFLPNSDPPVAYITNMLEGTLWSATWQPGAREFAFAQLADFADLGQGVPLEIYFNRAGDRALITTAKPGHLNVYDISEPSAPKHLAAIQAAAGAHHLVLSPDERYAFVQNNLLNLPGMNDGSISVIDLTTFEKVDSIDTLKDAGFNPNCIVPLPEFGASSH
jgi:DNA-binding beta-propeller fold protein YncE